MIEVFKKSSFFLSFFPLHNPHIVVRTHENGVYPWVTTLKANRNKYTST